MGCSLAIMTTLAMQNNASIKVLEQDARDQLLYIQRMYRDFVSDKFGKLTIAKMHMKLLVGMGVTDSTKLTCVVHLWSVAKQSSEFVKLVTTFRRQIIIIII